VPQARRRGGHQARPLAALAGAAALVGVSMLFVAPAAPRAQVTTAKAPVVIAAYLLNFIKFVAWPPEVVPQDAPIVVCVADPPVADAVSTSLLAWPAGARPVTLSRVAAPAVPADCGVLYVAALDDRAVATVLAGLRGRSVLSVSTADDFAKRGGAIGLFFDGGTMKFAVNPQAVERARLRVDSRLLKLARIVKESE
jgi:hypothetical protein